MSKLSREILDILNTIPVGFDPEDDIYEETKAKVVEKEEISDQNESLSTSKLRQQNVSLLENENIRYQGKKITRNDIFEKPKELSDKEDVLSNLESEHSNDSYESEEGSDQNSAEDIDENSGVEIDEGNEVDHNENSELASDDNSELIDNKEDDIFKPLSGKVAPEIEKGHCVKNQLLIWENLLEIRIQLQKSLLNANKLPPYDIYKNFKKEGGDKFSTLAKITEINAKNLLEKLITLQKVLLKSYPETKNLSKKSKNDNTNNEEILSDSDEEILSDSDEEIPNDTVKETDSEEENEQNTLKKKRKLKKLQEYEEIINQQHENFKSYRNEVIQKWNDKTRLVVSKNQPNNSVLSQIEYILKDKVKCLKRTQLKRANYNIIGVDQSKKPKLNGMDDTNEIGDINEKEDTDDYNPEIFDDTDFYHQLLRELIEYKSSDITDPVKLSQQWIQLQNLRSKMKRNIDTRATKGRKIKYVVHQKLVNFMAPIDRSMWTEESKTELYNSLFNNQ